MTAKFKLINLTILSIFILSSCNDQNYIKQENIKTMKVIKEAPMMKKASEKGIIRRYIPKNSVVDIIGYKKVNENGETHLFYHIKNSEDIKGWIPEEYFNYNATDITDTNNVLVLEIDDLKLYQKPFITSRPIKNLNRGEYVILKSLHQRENDWYQIQTFDFFTGWIKKDILDVNSSLILQLHIDYIKENIDDFPKSNLELIDNDTGEIITSLDSGMGVISNLILVDKYIYYYKYLSDNGARYFKLMCRDSFTGDLIWEKLTNKTRHYRPDPGQIYYLNDKLYFIYSDFENNEHYYVEYTLSTEEISKTKLPISLGEVSGFIISKNTILYEINNKRIFSYDLLNSSQKIIYYSDKI
ncbi:MAG: SH3 domain-containing protein, partial [bacterium]|nr:SH3 domain-containing protein [bacterium]